jgi:hypothetical protein
MTTKVELTDGEKDAHSKKFETLDDWVDGDPDCGEYARTAGQLIDALKRVPPDTVLMREDGCCSDGYATDLRLEQMWTTAEVLNTLDRGGELPCQLLYDHREAVLSFGGEPVKVLIL